MSKKTKQITITIDVELYDKLIELMKKEFLPLSRVISRIIKKYFD